MSENGLDSATETIDPRVQIELERLNSATDDINKLEVDLDEARASFRSLLCDSAARLDGLSRKLGSCIEKARPYYEARMRASEAAKEAQDAAVQYERANSAHSAAREMVYLAEQGLGGRCTLDPAWQEMLNHATQRVNEAESARALAGAQHMKAGRRLGDTAAVAQRLQRELRRSITKSRPYFEMKAQFNQQLELQKIKVQALEKQVGNAKLTYAEALRNLEQISDEIHRHRRLSRQHEPSVEISNKSREKYTRPPDKPQTVQSNRFSDPIASFPEFPYNESSTAVFYNQTYLPDSQSNTKLFESSSRFSDKYSQHERKCDSSYESVAFDEYKSLPKNISPKSTPIKTKHRPEEISGYRNISNEQFYPTNPFKTAEIEMKNVCEDSKGLTKSITNEWTEINLDSSSPEDLTSDPKVDIPYQRFDATSPDRNEQSGVILTPKKRTLKKQMTLPTNSETKISSIKSKMKLDSNISNWISRSSAKCEEAATSGYNSSRRQSLDNILGPTSEKVKEIFSHGIMMLNISSLTERRNSEPRCVDSPTGEKESAKPSGTKKIPSPLEKTLTYLTSNNDEDTTGSDTDSLASCDMLTEEQIQSLMLDRDIDLVCEQLLGTPISEICPKLCATPTAVAPALSEASVEKIAAKAAVVTSLTATSSLNK